MPAAENVAPVAQFGPVAGQQRIQVVDVLRGFALLGILLPNWANTTGGLSKSIHFLAEGSFYTAYSFLFGLGFALQLLRAENAARPFILRYLWRTAILGVIGAAHLVFIWSGDILLNFALLAWLLLLVRRWRPSLILALAAASLMFAMSPRARSGPSRTRSSPTPVETANPRTPPNTTVAQTNPPPPCDAVPGMVVDYRQSVCLGSARVVALLTDFIGTAQGGRSRQAVIVCMFLLGLYAGRRRIFDDVVQHTRLLAWVACVALVVALAGRGLEMFRIALPNAIAGWRVYRTLGNIGLSLFYLSSVSLLFTHWHRAKAAMVPLATVGRMSLTNYLMQSVMFSLVLGRGLGLIAYADGTTARVAGWYSVLLINAFFVVQVLYSNWWFQRFQFGPVEWAWRSLTWFHVQPMRVNRVVPAA